MSADFTCHYGHFALLEDDDGWQYAPEAGISHELGGDHAVRLGVSTPVVLDTARAAARGITRLDYYTCSCGAGLLWMRPKDVGD